MPHKLKENKKLQVLIVFISLILLVICIVGVLYIRWNAYMKNTWQPFIDVLEESGEMVEGTYIVNRDGASYSLMPPSTFIYGSNVCIDICPPYDVNKGDEQYDVSILVWLEKDEYKWGAWVDRITGPNEYEPLYRLYIDPDTLEVLSEDASQDDLKEYESTKENVRDAVEKIRDFWYPLLG